MLKWFKDKDMFGHVVNINFDKQGPTHKTEIGGVVSVFIKVVIYVYIIFKFKILILGEKDVNNTLISLEKLTEMGEVFYKDTDHFTLYVLRK